MSSVFRSFVPIQKLYPIIVFLNSFSNNGICILIFCVHTNCPSKSTLYEVLFPLFSYPQEKLNSDKKHWFCFLSSLRQKIQKPARVPPPTPPPPGQKPKQNNPGQNK